TASGLWGPLARDGRARRAPYQKQAQINARPSATRPNAAARLRKMQLPEVGRQRQREDGALPGRAVDRDLAAMSLDDLMDQRQPEAGRAPFRLGREEGIEDAVEMLGPDAGAGVRDAHGDQLAVLL